MMKKYRMVSWWLRPWHPGTPDGPDPAAADELRRRADLFAENHVDTAIIFGAHFRWDFADRWDVIHGLIRFCADELHQRGIRLWDHHSSVLVNRYDDDPRKMQHCLSNHRHLLTGAWLPPFADQRNDWKMIDLWTGKPNRLPQYGAQEFCFNNPDFAAAYQAYLQKLLAETHIDGLMSDDAFYDGRFYSCVCPHCLARYGKALPGPEDLNFWGNWNDPDFLDWVRMRHDSVRDFNAKVAAALPPDFPLMNCCCGSANAASNGSALTIESYLHASNHAMLEMCGDTPALDGTFTGNLATQLHQLAAARKRNAPVFGLGYGFSEVSADFIWAFNQFLGSSMWFSQLLMRMWLPDDLLKKHPEDAELAGHAFAAEKKYADWFSGEHLARTALLFSRKTMTEYGGYQVDYEADFHAAARWLLRQGIDFDVVLAVADAENHDFLLMPSAACLSEEDKTALAARTGLTFAAGPLADVEVPRIEHPPMWPADYRGATDITPCRTPAGWRELRHGLYWNPQKWSMGDMAIPDELLPRDTIPAGWLRRTFRAQDGRSMTHYLIAEFDVALDQEKEALSTKPDRNNHYTKSLRPRLHAPAIPVPVGSEILEPLTGRLSTAGNGKYTPSPECYYFIVRQ